MEEGQMLLDSLVNDLQQSVFDIPFDAWFEICKKVRFDVHEVHKSIQLKELTDVEARLAYARYMFHVSTNYRELYKSIITGYPAFQFPDEVKNMLMMAKIHDHEKEHQESSRPGLSSLSSQTSKSPVIQSQSTTTAASIMDKNKSDNLNCSQNKRMISSNNRDDDDSVQREEPSKCTEYIGKPRLMDGSSRLLFINPEPPSKQMKMSDPVFLPCSSTTPPTVSPFVDESCTHLDRSEVYDTMREQSGQGDGEEESESLQSTQQQQSNFNYPSQSGNFKRDTIQPTTPVDLPKMTINFPWVTPRLIYIKPKMKGQGNIRHPILGAAMILGNFILASCDKRSTDPRSVRNEMSKDSESSLSFEEEENVQVVGKSYSPSMPTNAGPSTGLMDSLSNEQTTANSLIENELSKCTRSGDISPSVEEEYEEEEEEEEEESEGEEVPLESFGDCFERRSSVSGSDPDKTDHDVGDGVSIISSLSDSSSSFYSASTVVNKDKNQVVATTQQRQPQSSFPTCSILPLPGTNGIFCNKMFRITVDNEYYNKTHPVMTPPSPIASPSLPSTIPTPVDKMSIQPANIYHDTDERVINNNSNGNPYVSGTILDIQSNTPKIVLPPTVPFHWHTVNFPANQNSPPKISTATVDIGFTAQSNFQFPPQSNFQFPPQSTSTGIPFSNPWVEAFNATKQQSPDVEALGTVYMNIKQV